ncbi:hypothetical protein LINPERPRIM_LOCUS24173 [Linum perenne]
MSHSWWSADFERFVV